MADREQLIEKREMQRIIQPKRKKCTFYKLKLIKAKMLSLSVLYDTSSETVYCCVPLEKGSKAVWSQSSNSFISLKDILTSCLFLIVEGEIYDLQSFVYKKNCIYSF